MTKLKDIPMLMPEYFDPVDYNRESVNPAKEWNRIIEDLGNKEICLDETKIIKILEDRIGIKHEKDLLKYAAWKACLPVIAKVISNEADVIKCKGE